MYGYAVTAQTMWKEFPMANVEDFMTAVYALDMLPLDGEYDIDTLRLLSPTPTVVIDSEDTDTDA